MKNQKRNFLPLFPTHYFLLIIICLPLLWNLLRPGFYASDDGEWMVIRLTAFHDALRQGQFPVRWLPRLNHGYGYPVANFLYPLPFYLAEPIYFLTGNPATAIQFIMAISIISMALGMFIWLHARNNQQSTANSQQNYKIWSAIVGTLVYVYSPYIAFNLYQRGSLGESVAMGIVPWIFVGVSRNKLPTAALLTAGLILSHNVVAVLFLPLIVIYKIYKNYKGYKNYKSAIFSLVLALSLSAFFWLPALAELRFVRAGQISVSDFQNEYLGFTEALNRTGIVTAIFSAGSPLFFLTKSSSWLWETLKFAQIIQFPWRLLSLFSFIAAVISAKFITKISDIKIISFIISIIIIVFSFASSIKYLTPASFINRPPEYYQTNDDTTTVRAEYTPIWVTDLPKQRPETPQIHYYPGWKIFIDGKKTAVLNPFQTNGILSQSVNPGLNQAIRYAWGETPLRTFSNLVSIVSALIWLFWIKKGLAFWKKARPLQTLIRK